MQEGSRCHHGALEHGAARGRDRAPSSSGQMGFIPQAPPGMWWVWGFHTALSTSWAGILSLPVCAHQFHQIVVMI